MYKLPGKGYGELPARIAEVAPWHEVAVNIIGPWPVKVGNETITFRALTCIDPITNLVEMARVEDKTSRHVGTIFENLWLSQYPRPERCIYDNGGEFTSWEFQTMLQLNQIKGVPITTKNPQANAISERMHQTVGNILRTLMHVHPPQNMANAQMMIDTALATAVHSLRSSVHGGLQTSPGALVFQRDMLLNIPLIADLQTIQERRQVFINQSLHHANSRRYHHDYQVGEQVMVLRPSKNKMGAKARVPFEIRQVHANGTVTIQVKPMVRE